MDQHVLGAAIRQTWKAANTEEGWINPLLDVVRGTTYEQAKWKPGGDAASIWEVLAHATPYAEGLLRNLEGAGSGREEEDWPALTDQSEAAWEALKRRLETAVTRLETVVAGLSDEALCTCMEGKKEVPASYILDIAIHNAYHAGQIMKLQQVNAAALNRYHEPCPA